MILIKESGIGATGLRCAAVGVCRYLAEARADLNAHYCLFRLLSQLNSGAWERSKNQKESAVTIKEQAYTDTDKSAKRRWGQSSQAQSGTRIYILQYMGKNIKKLEADQRRAAFG